MTKLISPILLAAGQSKRFGSDKLLHPVSMNGQKQTLIEHTLSQWLAVFEHLNVVVRMDNAALINVLTNSPLLKHLNLIQAQNPEQGMSASLLSGISALTHSDAWLIGLADMPSIPHATLQETQKALSDGAEITVPVYEGKRGHPVGFSAKFKSALQSLYGDKGARSILESSPQSITTIHTEDSGILMDIDTPENLASLAAS